MPADDRALITGEPVESALGEGWFYKRLDGDRVALPTKPVASAWANARLERQGPIRTADDIESLQRDNQFEMARVVSMVQ